MRYKLRIEYDGTDYSGWQKQDKSSSIQEHIEIAIEKFCGEKSGVSGAGRTDAGVHASGQVAHVDFNQDRDADQIRKGINFYLKNEKISILDAERVPDDFDARFSAIMRYYRYKIVNRQSPLTYHSNTHAHVKQSLDISIMQQAADYFIGKHDFTTFRSAGCQSKSPIKSIEKILITEQRDKIYVDFIAKSFLHTQVRSIMGCILKVGTGSWDLSMIPDIIAAKDRAKCATLAPSCGLYLRKIDYGCI